jgi:Lon protease-like protein
MTIVKNFIIRKSDLPKYIPLLPLDDVILLPTAEIPVEISQPNYLNMVDDIFKTKHHLVGVTMRDHTSPQQTACVGKIVSFIESENGKYFIVIQGISRFTISKKIKTRKGYDKALANWSNFTKDNKLSKQKISNRPMLDNIVKDYLSLVNNDMHIEFSKIKNIPDSKLVSFLGSYLPFQHSAKQNILNADSLEERSNVIMNLMAIEVAKKESVNFLKN